MSRRGGNKLSDYFIDYIKGKTRRAYSSYYPVKLTHGSVMMCKRVGMQESKEMIKFNCPKGTVIIFYGDVTYSPEVREAAEHKAHKNGLLAQQISENFMDLKLLDFREQKGRSSGGTEEMLIRSLMFEDQGNNQVLQTYRVVSEMDTYLPAFIDETRQYTDVHNFRVPKGINTIDEAEKYWFEKEYQTTPDKCYRINGKLLVPCSNPDLKEQVLSNDVMTRILNPYTGLAPRSIEFIRKFGHYFRTASSAEAILSLAQRSSGPVAADILLYDENWQLARKYEVVKSKAIDYLFAGAILRDGLPAIDYMRDENESEYVKGTFKRVDNETEIVVLNDWYLIC